WDYAQRRIFQITDTRSVLFNTTQPGTFGNVRVEITNKRPVISNDGRVIAFSSNATTSTPATPDATNPGNFDGNAFSSPTPVPGASPSPSPTPADNPLTRDGNMEMWLYQIPPYSPADLRTGAELPLEDLSVGGGFIRITNTDASRLPVAGSSTAGPIVADDNHDASINDDGLVIAFVSTRDLVPCVGNSFAANEDNDEIFTYTRGGTVPCPGNPVATQGAVGVRQVTKTPRAGLANPIYSKNPTISGDGGEIVFASTGDGPIVGMSPGGNPVSSRNEEIFFSDLVHGSPTGGLRKTQVTSTTPSNPGDPVNILDLGRRMDRSGRYIAFDSYADLGTSGANLPSFALYVYDTTTSIFTRVGPRSDADSAAGGGDVQHYPGFTDYPNGTGTATTLVLETRLNIRADGTVATTPSEGLNDNAARPTQIYAYPLPPNTTGATFTRLTKFPAPNTFLASTQPIPSNTQRRITFNLALTEIGTGNPDLQSESYYLLNPEAIQNSTPRLDFFTGASRRVISSSPVPTPSPTASPSPSVSPSPTPVTPSAVFGSSPGSLAILTFTPEQDRPLVARVAVGSLQRSFTLPIELSGVSLSVNGVACGLKAVSRQEITFVVPPALAAVNDGTKYPVVINNNGLVTRGELVLVPARPDVFTTSPTPGPGGRAFATNATNPRVQTTEPFTVRTIRIRGGVLVPTVLRLRLTGIANVPASAITIRIGSQTISGTRVLTGGVLTEPGVYTVDFTIPPELAGLLDQPIVVSVTVGGVTYTSRLDDTAPKLSFL
ncbi:MAG: hypothetical protein LC734_03185, partial [Acidobacteria bacterium]|nr:hypothetical protein [Acidobacteriota bacterium]